MTEEKNADERPVVLKVDHVAKMFRLPTEQATGLKMAFLNWTKGIKGYTEQHVLRDINFEVRQGDFFGIVGRNGSGKSTLLKIISQIYTPEHGSVTVKGKLVPFIELGVGLKTSWIKSSRTILPACRCVLPSLWPSRHRATFWCLTKCLPWAMKRSSANAMISSQRSKKIQLRLLFWSRIPWMQ